MGEGTGGRERVKVRGRTKEKSEDEKARGRERVEREEELFSSHIAHVHKLEQCKHGIGYNGHVLGQGLAGPNCT